TPRGTARGCLPTAHRREGKSRRSARCPRRLGAIPRALSEFDTSNRRRPVEARTMRRSWKKQCLMALFMGGACVASEARAEPPDAETAIVLHPPGCPAGSFAEGPFLRLLEIELLSEGIRVVREHAGSGASDLTLTLEPTLCQTDG